jgi:hypothetical protein
MTIDRTPGTGTPARNMTTHAATHHTEPHPEVVNAARLAALKRKAPAFVSLERETRAAVETECAAFHLNRQSQTLRIWAMRDSGPIRAFRVHGRLMWPTAKLRELCGVA